MIALLVLLAAVAGTIVRVTVSELNRPGRPVGTLAVNVVGAFVLGILAGTSADTITVAGVGYLGSMSTFSTVMREIGDDVELGWSTGAAAYAVVTVVLGVAAAWIGLALAG